jgi:hypothetical protein
MKQCLGFEGTWYVCTLALYMMLSNEGWTGQTWGLKSAMQDILEWQDTNELELDSWLVLNGYYKGTHPKEDSLERRQRMFLEGTLSPDKGEMWRAPAEILGKYCVLDAEACYLLFTQHLLPVAERFDLFWQERFPEFMSHIQLHISQKLWGMELDLPLLHQGIDQSEASLYRKYQEIRNHPDLAHHIIEIESNLLHELAITEPALHRKQKLRPPEPPRYKKDGTQSKTWENWVQNESKYQPVVSKNWQNWKARWDLAISGQNPKYRFNVNSDPQMISLLYDRLGFPVRMWTEGSEHAEKQPSTSIKAFKQMGDIGALFVDMMYLVKERGFLTDYSERTQYRTTIHPSFRLPGTKTGRLSSKEPNLQQVPKTQAMMSLFQARPGYLLVDLDFAALESVVAAELSGDPNLLALYGDGVPENDIHLFLASQTPGLDEKILSTGYRPYNPPPGTVALAKKVGKAERSKAKTVVYACQFGAGVDRIVETLEKDDIFLPREEVATIHSTYWTLFKRLKKYSYELQSEVSRNGGFVLNGMGRPMCLPEGKEHDALSRVIQGTGHDLLIKYVQILTRALDKAGLEWHPWVIDLHDATTVEVREQDAEQVREIFIQSMDELNRVVGGTIKLKGTPTVGRTMSEIKEPEE